MALLLVGPPGAAQAPLSVEVETRPLTGEASPDRVEVAVAAAGIPETVERHVLHEAPGQLRILAPATASGWIVRAEAPGWWAPTVRVVEGTEDVSVTLVPERSIRFELEAGDVAVEALDSSSVKVFGRLWTEGERLDPGLYGGPCEVGEAREGRAVPVSCPFAFGETADLRVTLGPFLPFARAGVTVTRDSDFGVVTPVRGATVSGRLEGGGLGGGPFLLGLSPRRKALPVTAWTDDRGAFVFEGIGPGTYDLTLEESPLDRWTVRVDSLSDRIDMGGIVSAAANRFALDLIAPPALLDLEGLAMIAFEIVKDGDGEPVGVLADRYVGEPSFDGSSFFHWSGLPADRYRIFVESAWGNRWFTEVVEFASSGHGAVTVDAVPVRGRVRRGSEPLENVLIWFGGLQGGQRIVMLAGHDGRFDGHLPRPLGVVDDWGSWVVTITEAPLCNPCVGDWRGGSWGGFDPNASAAYAGVFKIVEGVDGFARLDIDLPDGRVAGSVVRTDGTSGRLVVPGASVRLAVEGARSPGWSAVTSETGSFGFVGIPEAVVEVTATAWLDGQSLRSDPLALELDEGDVVEDVEVVLRRQRRLRLVVRSGGSAVRGAVGLVSYDDPRRGRQTERRTARGDGAVTFWIPFSSDTVDVVVYAEGLGTDGWRLRAPFAEEMLVELFEARGELLLPPGRGSEASIVSASGIEVPLSLLRNNGQTRDQEEGLLVRNLAPGHYSWCLGRAECTRVQVVAGAMSIIGE